MQYKIIYIITCLIIIIFAFDLIKAPNKINNCYEMNLNQDIHLDISQKYKPNFNVTTPEMKKVLNQRLEEYHNKIQLEEQKKQEQEEQKILISNKSNSTVTSRGELTSRNSEWKTFTATAYCGCSLCCR